LKKQVSGKVLPDFEEETFDADDFPVGVVGPDYIKRFGKSVEIIIAKEA
jgi:hypothetical protein